MKLTITVLAIAVVSGCFLTACAAFGKTQNAAERPVHMTQPIATDGILSKGEMEESETAEPTETTETIEMAETAETAETAESTADASARTEALTEYCRIKAELDALDIDQDLLEADYRVGKLDKQAYNAQKEELKRQEDSLDLQKDLMKDKMKASISQSELPEGTAEELIALRRAAKDKKDSLEELEDQLEEQYRNGEVSRADYIERQTDILIRDELAGQEKDDLEDALERMGIDD